MAVFLWYGGAVRREILPGLPDPGFLTAWALPAARLGSQLFATATIGLLLAAAALSPWGERGMLSASGYRRVRACAWTALLWCGSSVAALCFTLADLLGLPVGQAVSVNSVVNFATTVPLGRAFALSAFLAAAVFLICCATLRVRGAVIGLVVAVAGVVPPVFTGHAAAASNHQLAVSGLLLHVVPVTVWAGGLLALVLTGRASTEQQAIAVRRFSRIAVTCVALVALSGLLSAYARISSWDALLTSHYGQLVLVKTGLILVLAGLGWWQRSRALPAMVAGNRRRFTVTATVEILVFAATMGTAVALSRTPAPFVGPEESVAQSLLGFPMPAPLTVARLFGSWLPEPLFLVAALAAASLYLAGVIRLRRRGDSWPVARTAAFLAACALVVVATSSGLARYAPVLFSVHMVQHLLLMMIAPILAALSAPATLALRALPKAFDSSWPGPREWLKAGLSSRVASVATQPLVALGLYVVSIYAMYFTGLYELALRSHAAHLLMVGHFLLVGYLFFWSVIGLDPAPHRPSHPVRMLMVLVAMILHAFLGVALMQSGTLLAADWFTALARPWGPSPLDDQRTAGGIAWSFGELPTLVVLAALFVQWSRADKREQRRLDRAADRGEDEALAAYNKMLAQLADRDGR
ncbi:cytochrome c oxidase assembly protein [Asanoa iriomotensis]|nr:cytochrome c oxidase assembly protein [Asanoa iriomotensis]